ncbi:A/G-specific adenine glycosylase [Nisaea sp.]|uniref:A/G-specific adenine glycosylase n=1 Tax=Nisaea sp. TaxID=2024842 RepID=UPI003A5C04AE
MHVTTPEILPGLLLDWYDRHRRRLPWRAEPGTQADPYHVWLSEIMLQQTTVVVVGPYFTRFLERWPSVIALADAPQEDVLAEWAGLGYYARARNLHKCAGVVRDLHGGRFPDTEDALLELPGIGTYTAAAVAAIAFGIPATPVDGNFERVMARMHAVETPLPDAKPELKRLSAALTPQQRPGDYAQAVMDLGATICTPRKPKCLTCPWSAPCEARIAGIAEELPRKKKKPQRPTRKGVAFWIVNGRGDILLRRRPQKGLLGGMVEIPSSEWREAEHPLHQSLAEAPIKAQWTELPGMVRHTFTHFHLELIVYRSRATGTRPPDSFWHPVEKIGEAGLPSVMAKIAKHALRHQ